MSTATAARVGSMLPRVTATRYVTPLREGGSLPGLMEADDLGTYVVKYHAAGQGPKTLVAEVISAALARHLGLPVPDLAVVDLRGDLAIGEPDQEVQELLRASVGLNLGLDFLPGAFDFDPRSFPVDADFAGRVLWFDAVVFNVDRSHRNPNMLFWNGPWLIDHGATLTFHHRWDTAASFDAREYDASTHVLIEASPDVAAADAALAPLLTEASVRAAVDQVPEAWLRHDADDMTPDEVRDAYVARILGRVSARDAWLPALIEAAGGAR